MQQNSTSTPQALYGHQQFPQQIQLASAFPTSSGLQDQQYVYVLPNNQVVHPSQLQIIQLSPQIGIPRPQLAQLQANPAMASSGEATSQQLILDRPEGAQVQSIEPDSAMLSVDEVNVSVTSPLPRKTVPIQHARPVFSMQDGLQNPRLTNQIHSRIYNNEGSDPQGGCKNLTLPRKGFSQSTMQTMVTLNDMRNSKNPLSIKQPEADSNPRHLRNRLAAAAEKEYLDKQKKKTQRSSLRVIQENGVHYATKIGQGIDSVLSCLCCCFK